MVEVDVLKRKIGILKKAVLDLREEKTQLESAFAVLQKEIMQLQDERSEQVHA
jgi:hypothetical protein